MNTRHKLHHPTTRQDEPDPTILAIRAFDAAENAVQNAAAALAEFEEERAPEFRSGKPRGEGKYEPARQLFQAACRARDTARDRVACMIPTTPAGAAALAAFIRDELIANSGEEEDKPRVTQALTTLASGLAGDSGAGAQLGAFRRHQADDELTAAMERRDAAMAHINSPASGPDVDDDSAWDTWNAATARLADFDPQGPRVAAAGLRQVSAYLREGSPPDAELREEEAMAIGIVEGVAAFLERRSVSNS